MKKLILMLMVSSGLFISCSNDDDDKTTPTTPSSKKFTVTIENIAAKKEFNSSGVFNMPVGTTAPGAAKPGDKYEFTVNAGRKQRLSFATMLAATNDLFFGPNGDGIALYDASGNPFSGEVTNQIYLWDAGTEVNEEPAVGPNTVTNQSAPNTGVEENGNVRNINDVTTDVFNYPTVAEVMKVTVAYMAGTEFKVTIENVSPSDALKTSLGDKPAPLSPGVWVIHTSKNPLYTVGMPDYNHGIETIAEDGNPAPLGTYAAATSGVTYPASPGVWVVHSAGTKPLFTDGMKDYAEGIEGIAEDGNPMMLGDNITMLNGNLSGAVFNTPVGSSSAGAALPGLKYEFSFDASKGDKLSFATMLAATNDVFFAPSDMGIELYNANGDPISGDVTNQIYLWDAGTEKNEEPAIGMNTVTNQLAPNTGDEEMVAVQLLSKVNDGYIYPAVNTVLKVTLTAN